MSHPFTKYCLYFSMILSFMLFYQSAKAQYDFTAADKWLEDQTAAMGGRSVLLVFKNNKLLYSRSVNAMTAKEKFIGKIVAKRTGKDADEMLSDFSPDHKIAIASCSKWLSAALVMTFIDDHQLKLSDTVGKFLPILSKAGKGNITITDCLSHMTGVKSGNIKESRKGFEKAATMDEAMESIAKMEMESSPGESFHYSSVGLQIAAAVIEKISGKDFGSLFKDRIAGPCEMTHTDFGRDALPIPAGSGYSTPNDYLNFLKMILNNGSYKGKSVLTKESVEWMQHNYAAGKKVMYSPAEAGNWGYGLGEWTTDSSTGDKRSTAVTSPGLFGSFPWIDNKNHYAAVLFTFYIKSEGRHERYMALKNIIDEAVAGK